MSQSTPKPRSAELDSLIARVGEVVDRSALAQLLIAGLERQKLERLVARSKSASGVPFSQLTREDLAERAAGVFGPEHVEASFDILRELDRATENERTIVASMPVAEVTARFVTDAALRIKRHGAQLVWALLRDERFAIAEAREVLGRYLASLASSAEAEAATVESAADRERTLLMAELAKREAALQQEATRNRDLEARLSALEMELAQRPQAEATESRRADKQVAHLERQVAMTDSLRTRVADLEAETEQLKRTVASLRGTLAERSTTAPIVAPPEPRAAAAFASAETVARAQLVGAASSAIAAALGAPLVSPPRRVALPRERQRVGVVVDVANIAGAARLLHEKSVDYHRLLDLCRDGRQLVEAHAYVIDKGAPGTESFVASLRHAYRVHVKRPKTFPDGTVKADWDLAIAVDALGLAERCDVIVIASGDGDYVPLVQGLKRRRVTAEAVAFVERSSHELVKAVDQFTELDLSVLMS